VDLIWFALACFGITNIVTQGKVFERPRELIRAKSEYLGHWVRCPMCFGFWVGAFISLVMHESGMGTLTGSNILAVSIFADAAISSACCWILFVILSRLGGGDL
jgi:hypothetical protein